MGAARRPSAAASRSKTARGKERALQTWPYPLWIAHRGAGKLAPENTLAAFRVGAGYGFRAFECDVKLSADGVSFLLHDTVLQRTTSGEGTAGTLDWHQLSQLDAGGWHSRGYAGEPIPSFAAIARYCIRNGHALDIEIKPTPGEEAETGRVVAREAAQLWQGQARPPLLTSFRPDALEAAREAAPQLPRGLLLDKLHDSWFEQARALDCNAVVTNYALMDAAILAQLHGAGMRALCYTVNDPAEAQRLLALGIDGLVTDAIDRFSPAWHTVD
jgi:glycerophosphoryl diester phosphodiesterase